MMLKQLVLAFAFTGAVFTAAAQKDGDNTIIVKVADTANLYARVRSAIVHTDLEILESSTRDTQWTKSEKIPHTSIYVAARVVLKRDSVEITGAYGLGYEDYWGFHAMPRGYKRAFYFRDSESWPYLRRIAIKLDSKITFLKESR
ncbi:MAG: hypothetical protein EOP04_32665 [Proteobacteria bacterium]|nr:MAG: hypothetical protein EOP04_32665 [Pseudomonadota bacterium]